MKIIEFHGGLGNQLFEYVYYLYLRRLFPNEKFFSYSPSRATKVHYGLEIQKWFDVQLPPTSIKTNFLGWISYWGIRVLRRLSVTPYWISDDNHLNHRKLFHEGWYQNVIYQKNITLPHFKNNLKLDSANINVMKQLSSCNSISVHVRRGDYLEQKNYKSVGGICTIDYYQKAIALIQSKISSPIYFFFSDDPQYVKDQFQDVNPKVVVDINKGEQSFYDMYLMAHAKNMILANSTFSCWAAYLNPTKGMIICPSKWNNIMDLNLTKPDWKTIV